MLINLSHILKYNEILNDFEFESKEFNILLGKHKENKNKFCILKIFGSIFECFFLDKFEDQYILNDYKNAGWYFKNNNEKKIVESFTIGNTIWVKFYNGGIVAEEEYDKINYNNMRIIDLESASLISLKFDNIRLSFDLHREDGPAYIEYYNDGIIAKESYFQNGKCFREEDLPCYIKYDVDGNVLEESYYKNGLIHRDNDLPARIVRDENGKILTVSWFLYGKVDRKNGPAEINRCGKKIRFCYYSSGKLHCNKNAAIVIIKRSDITKKEYMLNGKNCGDLEKVVIQSIEPDDKTLINYLLEEAKKAGF